MKKVFLMVALAFSVAATSCCKEPVFGDDPRGDCGNGKDPKPATCEPLKVETISDKLTDCIVNDKIQRAWIEGDNLKIEVAYGGCNQHDFDLRWSGIFLESFPPQATIDLLDNTGEQMCKAYFQHTLCFDITKLRDGNNGSVFIRLTGYMQQLEYKY